MSSPTDAGPFSPLLRARARLRWARRYRRLLRASDLAVVSHTKSGRTWLRAMLSHLFHQRYGISERLLIKHDNFRRLEPACPAVFFSRDVTLPSFAPWRARLAIPREMPCLFLVRDPRDVAVSFYFHLHKRASVAELDRKGIRAADLALSMYAFCASPRVGVPRVVEHLNRWRAELEHRQRALLLRYEDLRADPEPQLRAASAWMGFEATASEIAAAVRFGAFASMREREREGRFEGDDVTPRDVLDADSFKARRGVIGGYRDYFDEAQIRTLDAIVAERLDPRLGYGAPAGVRAAKGGG